LADPVPARVSDRFEESFLAREHMRTLRAELRQQARELEQDRIRRDAFAAVRDRLKADAEAAEYEEAERQRLYRGTQQTGDTSHDLHVDHGIDYDDQ
jgi:DNA-binding SARP family transcriptional activator